MPRKLPRTSTQKSRYSRAKTGRSSARSKSEKTPSRSLSKDLKAKNAKPAGRWESVKDSVELRLGHDVWPMERDVLFRPDRQRYVRKLLPKGDCVFCRAAGEGLAFSTLCLKKTPHSMIVLNKYPYNSGHLLVLPRKHVGDFADLTEVEWQDLQGLVRLAVAGLKDLYAPSGFNIGLNMGPVSGGGIPDHLHYHVVPRWAGDLNFFGLIAETKVVIEQLEETYQRLFEYFQR